MKQFILFMLAALLSIAAFSQTIIKPKKGDEIKAKIISKEGNEIEYKLYYFQEGASFKIAKSDVLYMQSPDGTRETFEPETPAQTNANNAGNNQPATNAGELTVTLNKVATQLSEINKGQDGQTKALNETLSTLNTTLNALKTTIEQGNTESKKQTEETNAKLNTLNTSVKELSEKNDAKTSSESNAITPRKFGMGVSFVTNYLLGNFAILDDYDNPSTTPYEDEYKGLFMGAGFNMIISTRMDKKVGFRYEPEFSVASRFSSQKEGNYTNTIRTSLFSFGSRFLGVARRNRVNIYAGPSLAIFGSVLSVTQDGEKSSVAHVGAGFGLHFGGEYLVHSNFGINMESGMQLYGLFPKGGYAEGIFSTYARLGGRFYF